MTKYWLIPFLVGELLGDKAFADCLPARDTQAAVIEYFRRFNKPLPEQFCAKDAVPQASEGPPQEPPQAEEAPDQYDDGPGGGPRHYYQGGSAAVAPRWSRSGSAVCPENFDYYDYDGLCWSRD